MSKYCIFGDSIVRGGGDPEFGGWTGRFLREKELGSSEDRVYPLGVNGEPTSGLLLRLEVECHARKPDVILFGTGINDSRYYETHENPETTIDQFQNNLTELIRIARMFTKKVYFVGLTRVDETKTRPIAWSPNKFYDNETITKYDFLLRDFCVKENLSYIDVSGTLAIKDMPDGIHPHSSGYEKLFEHIRKFDLI